MNMHLLSHNIINQNKAILKYTNISFKMPLLLIRTLQRIKFSLHLDLKYLIKDVVTKITQIKC